MGRRKASLQVPTIIFIVVYILEMEKKIEALQSQLHKQEEIVKEKDQLITERNKKNPGPGITSVFVLHFFMC